MKKVSSIILGLALAISFPLQGQDSLDIHIGQMIMVGIGDFSRLDKSAPIFQSIRSGKTGGVILFEKNLSSKNTEENLKEIISYAQAQASIPLLVSIDEEGGRVSRLKPKYGFLPSVTAQYLGTVDHPDTTRMYAGRIAASLYRLGINMNFAPDVDVNVNPQNPVIGGYGRSYSADPKAVARHAALVMHAHATYGIIPVIKHFPGHGSSKNDTHMGMADVSGTWQFQELLPYKILIDSGKVTAVMTAHIVNDALDPSKLPSTLSPLIVTGILREFLGFNGVVVSDDMQMRAISKEYGLEEAVKKAVLAGVDILLFANNVPDYELVTAEQIFDIVKGAVLAGEIPAERIAQSYQRIMQLKASLPAN